MEVRCPKCGRVIDSADASAAEDLALCRACNEMFAPRRGLTAVPVTTPQSGPSPPWGARFRRRGGGFEVRATVRHPRAYLSIPGLVLYAYILSAGITVEFHNILAAYGVRFFVWLALVVGPTVLLEPFLFFGDVRLAVDGDAGRVFTGMAGIGLRRRFAWSQVSEVRLRKWFWGDWVRPLVLFIPTEQIVLVGADGRTLARCAALLTYKRRRFLYDVLCRRLAERDAAGHRTV